MHSFHRLFSGIAALFIRKSVFFSLIICSGCQPQDADNKASQYYESIKSRGKPFLTDYFKDFPKGGDLHCHLGGAIAAFEWLKAAERHHLYYSLENNSITDHPLPGHFSMHDLKLEFGWEAFYEKLSLRGDPQFPQGHDNFFDSFNLINQIIKYAPLEELFPSFLLEARANRVQYVELMVGSHLYPKIFHRQFDLDNPEQAALVLKPAIDQFIQNVSTFLDRCDHNGREALGSTVSIYSDQSPVCVRFIIEVTRTTEDLERFYFRILAACKLIQIDPRIRGINIVGAEDSPLSIENFEKQIKIANALTRHYSIPMALHAGELTVKCGSGSHIMTDRLSKSLKGLQTLRRLGHANTLCWDQDRGLPEKIRKRDITIEVCPSSSLNILHLAGANHPVHLFLARNIPIVIGTDDPGINNSWLTNEYVLLALWAPYLSHKDFKNIAIRSLEAAFLDGEGIYEQGINGYYKLKQMFFPLVPLSDKARLFLEASERARIEYRHALEMTGFENKLKERSKN